MNKKYYLVIEESYFIDPHGTPDFGGIKKKVTYTDRYNNLDLSKTYTDNLDIIEDNEWDEFCEDNRSEDGYNSKINLLYISEVSKEKYDLYNCIIEDFENLK